MSLLDELSTDKYGNDHLCRISTKYGKKTRKAEGYLFAKQKPGATWECKCGRRLEVINYFGSNIWKEQK